jgi:hypothetical protein
MAKLTVHFTTDLGAQVSVEIDEDDLLETLRRYGKRRWTSGEIPTGGYSFPYDNERDFDWALIGASPFTTNDGDQAVWHKGHLYKRRDLVAVESKKMTLPAAVKYSRGAKTTDPPHLREQADGEIEYVTLAVFRGGKRQERYALEEPAARSSRRLS